MDEVRLSMKQAEECVRDLRGMSLVLAGRGAKWAGRVVRAVADGLDDAISAATRDNPRRNHDRPRPPEPWHERIGADVRQVPTTDLRRLEQVLAEIATWDVLGLGDQARLVLTDLAAELRSALTWRSTQAWMLEREVFEAPDPDEPVRHWWPPPGWRRPDDEAVGL